MLWSASTVRAAAAGLTAAGLVSCGGYGGGGGGYMGGMMNPMPTVSITAPAQATTVRLGQAVQIKWMSTYATACTGGTSSSIGGAFSGSQAMSGTATVAPTGTGTVTYSLTCTGNGGSTKVSSPTVTVSPSILSSLAAATPTTIGSTVDPMNGENNPYGLAIAPATAGLITAGDLVVCNFNDPGGTEGQGTTIVGLHPTAGATPYRIAQSATLLGCNALAMLPDDSISAAAWSANANALVTPAGVVNTPFSDAFANPWGEAFVAAQGKNAAALYVSNFDGAIDRITLNGDAQTAFTTIVNGFCGSGSPGSIYAPAGLTYDASIDTLYIVDTSSNSVVALANVSMIGASGVVVDGKCAAPPTPTPTFSGPSASSARIIAHGAPLFTPLSAALLADGDLLIGNADINAPVNQTLNLAIEVSPWLPGGFVGQPLQLDAGAAGALFGIVATTDAQGKQIVYFNDDNANSVMMLAEP